jgi:hypothetical protein
VPSDAVVQAAVAEARADHIDIPPYSYDCHTAQGKRAGKTRDDFVIDEHDALRPRVPGLFDGDLDAHRRKTIKRKGGR